jgi:hypothetical protein
MGCVQSALPSKSTPNEVTPKPNITTVPTNNFLSIQPAVTPDESHHHRQHPNVTIGYSFIDNHSSPKRTARSVSSLSPSPSTGLMFSL